MEFKCKEIKSGPEGSAEPLGALRVQRQVVPWPPCPQLLASPDQGRDTTCWLVFKLVRKGLSAKGTFVRVVAFFFPDIDLAFLLSFLP